MRVLTVRPTEVADAQAVADIQVSSWRAAYRGIIPAPQLAAMTASERAGRYAALIASLPERCGHWVACVDGRPVGFVAVGPSRDDDADRNKTGEIFALYVEPDHWGEGAGRELMTIALDYLTGCEFAEVTLWVLAENQRGRRFYTAAGFTADGGEADIQLGRPVREVRYRRLLQTAAGSPSRS